MFWRHTQKHFGEGCKSQNKQDMIEAYTDIPERKRPPVEMYMGSLNTFLTAGFNEVAKAGLHVIVRKQL
jgi:hypothetical protein